MSRSDPGGNFLVFLRMIDRAAMNALTRSRARARLWLIRSFRWIKSRKSIFIEKLVKVIRPIKDSFGQRHSSISCHIFNRKKELFIFFVDPRRTRDSLFCCVEETKNISIVPRVST